MNKIERLVVVTIAIEQNAKIAITTLFFRLVNIGRDYWLVLQFKFSGLKGILSSLDLKGIDSLTDAVHLINYSKIPTISIGVDSSTAHKTDEYADIDQLVKATKIMALTILRWCGYT